MPRIRWSSGRFATLLVLASACVWTSRASAQSGSAGTDAAHLPRTTPATEASGAPPMARREVEGLLDRSGLFPLPSGLLPDSPDGFARTRAEAAPRGVRTVAEPAPIATHMAWGALIGASFGTLTGLAVLSMCGSECEGLELGGMLLHIAVGAGAGTAIGAIVYALRE